MNKYSVNLIIQHFPTLIDKTWQVFIKSSYNKFEKLIKLRRKVLTIHGIRNILVKNKCKKLIRSILNPHLDPAIGYCCQCYKTILFTDEYTK
jgi:hypothetical protein